LIVEGKNQAMVMSRIFFYGLKLNPRARLYYQEMLTKFTPSIVKPYEVTVCSSGNRSRTLMENQLIMDERALLVHSLLKNLFPVISNNLKKHFTWMGDGEMSKEEREKLVNNRFNRSCQR
jgi:hypothetical protein